MKKLIFAFIGFTGLFAMSSCTKQPTACLEFEDRTYIVGEEVTFDASCSEDALSYTWFYHYDGVDLAGTNTFDNDNEVSFDHTFNSPCEFSITVTAESKGNRKRDDAVGTLTVVDGCWECISGQDTVTYCSQNYSSDWNNMYGLIRSMEEAGATCTAKK